MPSTPPNFTPLGTPSSSSGPQPLPPHPPFFCKTNLPGSPELQLGPFTLPPLLPLFAKQTQSTPIRHFAKQTQVRSAPPPTGMPPTPTPHFCKTNPPGNPERLLGPFTLPPLLPLFAKQTQSSPKRHFAKQTQVRSAPSPTGIRLPIFAKRTQSSPIRHFAKRTQHPTAFSLQSLFAKQTHPPPASTLPLQFMQPIFPPLIPLPDNHFHPLCATPFPEFHPCLKNPCI